MTFSQVITPNPHIPCKPGWCLEYVRSAYGLPAAYPTATAAWEASTSKHQDQDFPDDCWVPVWFSLANEPAGHVALRAPDGSVYSTSDLTSIPHQHPNLADLMHYYAYYGMSLTYLGWTEDVAGYPVITNGGIAAQGTITQEDDTLAPFTFDDLKRAATEGALAALDFKVDNSLGGKTSALDVARIVDQKFKEVPDALLDAQTPRAGEFGGNTSLRGVLAYADQKHIEALRATATAAHGDGVSADAIITAVREALAGATITLGGK